MTRVLVFGTFDGLHEGHRAMLREARAHGDELIAVVALDATVERLKGKLPKRSLVERVRALEESGLVQQAIPGDEREGEYTVFDRVQPQIVAFGYDQNAFRENFLKFLTETGKTVRIVTLSPFSPETYKSSKLL